MFAQYRCNETNWTNEKKLSQNNNKNDDVTPAHKWNQIKINSKEFLLEYTLVCGVACHVCVNARVCIEKASIFRSALRLMSARCRLTELYECIPYFGGILFTHTLAATIHESHTSVRLLRLCHFDNKRRKNTGADVYAGNITNQHTAAYMLCLCIKKCLKSNFWMSFALLHSDLLIDMN